ncbi:hypothetical protein [Vibrio comitans]|uniref:Uncharacterized protein n=1 Tax=Vibrio comitans NBRC 102076 TaxID=1219078 RepID=A0A4Y3IIE3_9VIBR|nr:hypothetical protein [Vibrio comitans]GEA59181.1 hypothetical protein VCO01S_03740 [Vibrio comitans NBRC 102076]
MNSNTVRQIHAVMRHYKKPGIAYRQKQVKRLIEIFDDVFKHEKNLGEQLERVGRKHLIGYWRRTEHESPTVRKEKYRVLVYFVEQANLSIKVPMPKPTGEVRAEIA